MVTVFAEIESIEIEGEGEAEGGEVTASSKPRGKAGMIGSRGAAQPSGRSEAAGTEQPLGPSDVVPIQYSAVPGTTTNVPGAHAYPPDVEGKLGVPVLGGAATIKVKLADPHSGTFEIKVGSVPAGTVAVGRCRLSLSEA